MCAYIPVVPVPISCAGKRLPAWTPVHPKGEQLLCSLHGVSIKQSHIFGLVLEPGGHWGVSAGEPRFC